MLFVSKSPGLSDSLTVIVLYGTDTSVYDNEENYQNVPTFNIISFKKFKQILGITYDIIPMNYYPYL